jgi:Ca2+-binding RTX toxin-like protein
MWRWTAVVVALAGCLAGAQPAAAAAPETTITAGPASDALTNDNTPTFEFSADQPATFACALDGGEAAAVPCSSPYTAGPLADGRHSVSIVATTGVEADPTPAVRAFTVDATPPDTSIVDGPADGAVVNDDAPSFSWASTEDGSTFACSADGQPLASCDLAFATGAAAGRHSFSVTATDAAGNVDPTPATRTFTISLQAAPPELAGCQVDGNVITGTNGPDTRIGTRGTDIMLGLGGNDLLRGGSGADCLAGQSGNDRLFGGNGNDDLSGGGGSDRLAGEVGDDELDGNDGNDRLTGGSGRDVLDGGAGNDVLTDAAGRDTFSGGPGNDRIDARDRSSAGRVIPDGVKCGPGRDVAIVDRHDRVAHDCERVRRR